MEKYMLSLNYEGIDYEVTTTDLETANLLLNDHDAAINYLQQNRPEIFNAKNNPEASHDKLISQPATSDADPLEVIWTRKRPTQADLDATKILLDLRQKYQREFEDKKNNKSKLWHRISEELKGNKINIGVNGGERCRQKFSNLTKSYIAYIKHQKTTGEEKTDEIPFFNEIHSIIGSKHKVNPKHLEDTMEPMQQKFQSEQSQEDNSPNDTEKEHVSVTKENLDPTEPASENLKNRFKTIKKTVRPKAKYEYVLEEIREDRKSREQQFSTLSKYLSRSEEQKDRFLNIMEQAFSRKRRREESDDST